MVKANTLPTVTTGGITATSPAFVAGDRGCLPSTDATTGVTQSTIAQLVLLTGATATANVADYASYVRYLCKSSGTCCFTDLCNASGRIFMNIAMVFVSTILMLIGFVSV